MISFLRKKMSKEFRIADCGFSVTNEKKIDFNLSNGSEKLVTLIDKNSHF